MKINGTPDGEGRDPIIRTLNVTENGTYRAPSGVDGYSPVKVNVDVDIELQDKTVIENGTYVADAGYDGLGTVIVNVPSEEPVLETLSVTENGTYTPSAGVDGYSSVEVSVPMEGYSQMDILSKNYQFVHITGDSITSIGPYVCDNMPSLLDIDLPNCTNIGEGAFKNCQNLTSVELDNCENIGNSAFSGCTSLSSIYTPNLGNLGSNAFYSTLLTSVNMPMLTGLGGSTFQDSHLLSSVNMPQIITMNGYNFYNCDITGDVEFPELESIGYGEFEYCRNLTSFTAPKLRRMDGYVFSECENLMKLDFTSDKVTYVYPKLYDNAWFQGTPLMEGRGEVLVNGSVYNNMVLAYGWSEIQDVIVPVGDTSIVALEWNEPTSTLSGATEEIHDQFGDYIGGVYVGSVYYVDLPDCKIVGDYAFNSSGLIGDVEFPVAEQIGNGAFRYSYSMTSITLPSCTYIKEWAFAECNNLQKIYLTGDSVCHMPRTSVHIHFPIPSGNFKGIFVPEELYEDYMEEYEGTELAQWIKIDLPELVFRDGVLYGGAETLTRTQWEEVVGDETLTEVNLPNCTYLEQNIFEDVTTLETVNLPSLMQLPDYAFNGCTSLTSFDFTYISSLGQNSFANSGLTSINIEWVNGYIGPNVFYGCTSLTDATICIESSDPLPNGIFSGCTSLTNLTLSSPNWFNGYNSTALENCTSLTNIYVRPDGVDAYKDIWPAEYSDMFKPIQLMQVRSYIIGGCTSLTPEMLETLDLQRSFILNLPYCTEFTSSYMFEDSEIIGIQSLGYGINIPDGTFQNCRNLQDAYGILNVNSIGERSFYGCSNLQNVSSYNYWHSVGNEAFYGCTKLKLITLDNYEVVSITGTPFDSDDIIVVPVEFYDFYMASPEWSSYYSNIKKGKEFDSNTGTLNLYQQAIDFNIIGISRTDLVHLNAPYTRNFSQSYDADLEEYVGCFENCTNLIDAVIDITWDQRVFKGCTSLTNVKITTENNSAAFNETIFEGCTSLQAIYVDPMSIDSWRINNPDLAHLFQPWID